ncbi:DNA-3-methyladenine glycosylase [Taibaiella koreensis]|uniref:DNA-3-methyladenine glycosylase n=1 Tax=Taibaiella koreensis TaxID=1268548 RepID=UPI000E59F04D|nr:DNA-3-methyladenine glycosylase [Taibaiella koreensis]
MTKLDATYYRNRDVLFLAKDLLGKVLVTHAEGKLTSGLIVETEAYAGVVDKASHAYGGRRTRRTGPLYAGGGIAYVYLCYGIHHLFNIVTSIEEEPHAVLLRAVVPLEGTEWMEARRGMPATRVAISSGPGAAAKALGIDLAFNGRSLTGDDIRIEDRGIHYPAEAIAAVPRVGVAYAKEDALLPWRFFVKGNPYVSKPNSFK